MNPYEILLTIVTGAAVIFGVAGIVVPKLQKKGINAADILQKTDVALQTADKAIDALKAVAPGIPYINEVDAVIGAADVATQRAEQLCKIGKLAEDQRKAEAVDFVKQMLTLEKVTITPELEKVIDGCCEAAVNALPATHTDSYELPAAIPAVQSGLSDEKMVSGDFAYNFDPNALANYKKPTPVPQTAPETTQNAANSAPANLTAGTGGAVPEMQTAAAAATPTQAQ